MRLIFLFALLLCCGIARAQHSVSGRVIAVNTETPVSNATVAINDRGRNQQYIAFTDAAGNFSFNNIAGGDLEIFISALGYSRLIMPLQVKGDLRGLVYKLQLLSVLSDEVIVKGIKAADKSATTFTNLGKKEIDEQNFGQDFPYLLNMTPSTVVSSDAGNGVGYTSVRIRGVDNARINVTVNGIPMNDAESHTTFWVDFPDLASSAQNVQVQRGVGTSTNGAAAFGASINVQTGSLSDKAFGEISTSAGSFNTLKNTLTLGTGLLDNGWSFDARLSRIRSDGFIDRGSSDLKSYFLSAGRFGKKSLLRFNTFSGKEITYQSWNGVPQEVLDTNRSWNMFTYDRQVDDYQQDHYQVLYSYQLAKKLLLNTALHYTRGKGFYEEYKQAQDLADYDLVSVFPGTTTDLVRRKWLDNHFFGGTWSLNWEKSRKFNAILGGAYNTYLGKHFHEVIWMQMASNGSIRHRYVDNDARKSDLNFYGKISYLLTKKLSAYADLQYRRIQYTFEGFDEQMNAAKQTVSYNFFNPKAGLVYSFSDSSDVYASYSAAHREPTREEFVSSTPQSRPLPELLHDGEAGWRKTGKRYKLQVNAYMMYYKNQLILTGQINDVGAYIRKNVPVSYRSGIELSGSLNITKRIQWSGNFTYSINRIPEYTEFVDNWDDGTQEKFTYSNTDIALSPSVVAGSMFRFIPVKRLNVDLITKYVGKQYLDNTKNALRSVDAYLVNDLRINYDFFPFQHFKKVRVGLLLNNFLNEEFEPGGYTWSAIFSGTRSDFNYFYPQAGRNFLLQLTLGF